VWYESFKRKRSTIDIKHAEVIIDLIKPVNIKEKAIPT
jgi:hypothetical protein